MLAVVHLPEEYHVDDIPDNPPCRIIPTAPRPSADGLVGPPPEEGVAKLVKRDQYLLGPEVHFGITQTLAIA